MERGADRRAFGSSDGRDPYGRRTAGRNLSVFLARPPCRERLSATATTGLGFHTDTSSNTSGNSSYGPGTGITISELLRPLGSKSFSAFILAKALRSPRSSTPSRSNILVRSSTKSSGHKPRSVDKRSGVPTKSCIRYCFSCFWACCTAAW